MGLIRAAPPISSRWLVLAVLAVSACGDGPVASPKGDAGPEAGPTICGVLPAVSDGCAVCQSAACCDQARSCADDPSCAAFETCNSACGTDFQCKVTCTAGNGGKVPDRWPALSTCRAAACAEACNAGCGNDLPSATTVSATCQACWSDKCCQQSATCAKDLACMQLLACTESCGTNFSCRAACLVSHQNGVASADAVATCGQGSECATGACGAGDLSCVGSVVWPPVSGAKFGLQMEFDDAQTGKPSEGVRVLACSRLAVECTPDTAIAGAYTDASGSTGVISNGFEIAWVRADGPGDTLPALLFFRPPLVSQSFYAFWFYSLSGAIQQMASAAIIDPKKAQFHVFVTDCTRRPMPGAVVEVELAGKQLPVIYSRSDSTPDAKLTATGLTGEARALNVPVTEADAFPLLDVTVKKDGKKVAHTSVRVHAGYWSELPELGPTPASE